MDQTNASPGQVGSQKESEHNISIPVYLILTLLSCGLFNIYWNYRQMEACNDLLGKKEFDFWLWFLLTIVTCGIYHIFYQYKMGAAIVEIQRNKNKVVFDNLPIISVLVTIFGLTVIVDCIHQSEINKIVS